MRNANFYRESLSDFIIKIDENSLTYILPSAISDENLRDLYIMKNILSIINLIIIGLVAEVLVLLQGKRLVMD
jgi:hypothetical protein